MVKEERRLKDAFREQHTTFNPLIMPLWGEHTLVLFGLKPLGARKLPQLSSVGDMRWEGWGERKRSSDSRDHQSSLESETRQDFSASCRQKSQTS